MEQFSLEKYLENTNRKVVTRRGNSVRIICTDRKHGEDELPIVFLEEYINGEFLMTCRKDGRSDNYDTQYDPFFADEEEKLTEFEDKLLAFALMFNANIEEEKIEYVKECAETLLDLARKELEANYYTIVLDDRMVFKSDLHDRDMQGAYELGKQDALKDLPKWKKVDSNPAKFQYNLQGKRLYKDGEYYIELSDLETLPKEE